MTGYRFFDSDRRKWENNSCKRKCKKQLDNQSCKQTNIMCQHLQHHVPTPAPQVTLQLQSLSLGKGLKQNTEGCKKASAWACKRRRARDTIMLAFSDIGFQAHGWDVSRPEKQKTGQFSGSSSADISSPSPNKEHKKKQWQSAEE